MFNIRFLQPDWQQGLGVSLRATYFRSRSWFVVTQNETLIDVRAYGETSNETERLEFRYSSAEEAEDQLFQMLRHCFPRIPSQLPPPDGVHREVIPIKLTVSSGLVGSATLVSRRDWRVLKQSPEGSIRAFIIRSFPEQPSFRIELLEHRFALFSSDASPPVPPERRLLTSRVDTATMYHLSHVILTDPELALSEVLLTWSG